MIVLFTDFSLNGPYVGQMKSVIKAKSNNAIIIDLMHDAPAYNIQAAAYLLASVTHSFDINTVFLAVVDPGVGTTQRNACVIKTENYWFVGPDNGLFNRVVLDSATYQVWEIDWQPEYLSDTFHGRDLFAPVAAQLESSQCFDGITYQMHIDEDNWPDSHFKVIYCDNFGNVMTGVKASAVTKSDCFCINGYRLCYARTFSEASVGHAFWYINSNNMVEFAVYKGRADQVLDIRIGNKFTLESQ